MTLETSVELYVSYSLLDVRGEPRTTPIDLRVIDAKVRTPRDVADGRVNKGILHTQSFTNVDALCRFIEYNYTKYGQNSPDSVKIVPIVKVDHGNLVDRTLSGLDNPKLMRYINLNKASEIYSTAQAIYDAASQKKGLDPYAIVQGVERLVKEYGLDDVDIWSLVTHQRLLQEGIIDREKQQALRAKIFEGIRQNIPQDNFRRNLYRRGIAARPSGAGYRN